MERVKKIIFCSRLNKEVSATYYIQDVKGPDGTIRFRTIEFYNCDGKVECEDNNIMDCSCFKEVKKVEMEINRIGQKY